MELIIGGAYQGKLTYAVYKHGFSQAELYDLSQGLPEKEHACLYHLEALTKAAVLEGMSAEELFSKLWGIGKSSVIISREIGSGIVPMDGTERAWRETHGVLLRLLTKNAASVTRIFCGIGEALK